MLTSKHDSFHRKEVATVHICGHYYRLKECSSFAEVEYIATSLPMMLVAVQVPMQCLPRNAMVLFAMVLFAIAIRVTSL